MGLVVLDEVHYLGDPDRGSVWEEVIINCPTHIQLLCLSATVANPDDLGGWISEARCCPNTHAMQRICMRISARGAVISATLHLHPIFCLARGQVWPGSNRCAKTRQNLKWNIWLRLHALPVWC